MTMYRAEAIAQKCSPCMCAVLGLTSSTKGKRRKNVLKKKNPKKPKLKPTPKKARQKKGMREEKLYLKTQAP